MGEQVLNRQSLFSIQNLGKFRQIYSPYIRDLTIGCFYPGVDFGLNLAKGADALLTVDNIICRFRRAVKRNSMLAVSRFYQRFPQNDISAGGVEIKRFQQQSEIVFVPYRSPLKMRNTKLLTVVKNSLDRPDFHVFGIACRLAHFFAFSLFTVFPRPELTVRVTGFRGFQNFLKLFLSGFIIPVILIRLVRFIVQESSSSRIKVFFQTQYTAGSSKSKLS